MEKGTVPLARLLIVKFLTVFKVTMRWMHIENCKKRNKAECDKDAREEHENNRKRNAC